MQSLKIVLLLSALFATAYAYSATFGQRNSTDVLLVNEVVVRSNSTYGNVTEQVVFPKWGQTNNLTITAIFVFDRFPNATGAIPSIYAGGIGYNFTIINLTSQNNTGINSTVEIFGR